LDFVALVSHTTHCRRTAPQLHSLLRKYAMKFYGTFGMLIMLNYPKTLQ